MKFIFAATSFMAIFLINIAHAGGNLEPRYIEKVTFMNHSGVETLRVIPTAPWNNPDGCDGSEFAVLKKSDWMWDEKLSGVLTALAANKEIEFYSTGCTESAGSGSSTRPKIWSLTIHKD